MALGHAKVCDRVHMYMHALLVVATFALSSATSIAHDVPPPPPQQCVVVNSTDFTGDDLKVGAAQNATACCTECSQTPGCNAWTLWTGGPQCYLKKDSNGKRPSPGHISGTVNNPMPDPSTLKNATDCLMRSLLIEYAQHVNPNIGAAEVTEMIDALQGDPMMGAGCVVSSPTTTRSSQRRNPQASPPHNHNRSTSRSTMGTVQFFADATHGNDANAGTEAAPFRTVARAVAAVRAANKGGGGTVTLRAGTFHLPSALLLTAADSDLTIETHTADAPNLAWLSGSTPLTNVSWKAVNTTNGANVWAADLSATSIKTVTAMRLGGRRLWKARFPNGDPERTFPFNSETVMAEKWLPSPYSHLPPVQSYTATEACGSRNDTVSSYTQYHMKMGGSSCAKYTPPISYYCGTSNGMDAGGGAVISSTSLPHQPYTHGAEGATITAMHAGRWCSFAYGVGNTSDDELAYQWDAKSATGTFTFTEGGQQCNRPEAKHGQLLIEGVLDELDEANEFHFDRHTHTLTLWHNATSGTPPPTDGTLEVTQLSVLVNATGSQATPVRGLSFNRVGFRDTVPTVFTPHVAPTAGDWAVNRHAALSVTGGVGVNVSHSSFFRLGNAGIFLGGYHRNATIADSDFAWLGESAIVSVGETQGVGLSATIYPGFGCDGTAGNQPRNTSILRNFARELGIVNKQSAFYFQAATSGSVIEGNVAFNGARSGINFNDAFGTGSTVTSNVLFNMNRETADHGPFNSWDRLPFTPSRDSDHRDLIELNYILSNFNSYNGLDTDDDSAYFHMLNNVLLYGHMLKSDYSGHSIEYDGVLGVFVAASDQYQPVPSTPSLLNVMHDCVIYSELYSNNLFSLTSTTCHNVAHGNTSDFPSVFDTVVHSPTATTTVCAMTISELQTKGKLKNVTTATLPHDAVAIVTAARQKLMGV